MCGALPSIIWRQKLRSHGSSIPGRTASGGWAISTIWRSATTWVTIHTSQPTYSARKASAPSAAERQSRHGATSAKPAGTISVVIPDRRGGESWGRASARAGEPVVVPPACRLLGGFLLRLGLQHVSLAGDGRGCVAVGLPVDLLGAAEHLLGLGPHRVEDAHGQTSLSPVGFRGPVRSSLRCARPC